MPIFEYKCTCGLRFEAVILDTKAPHETSVCPRCKGQGQKREFPTSVSLSRSTMGNPTMDLAVGKSAEEGWNAIHQRDEIKTKVRKETGEVGLSLVAPGEYVPVTPTKKELRTSITETIAATGGFKNSEPVSGLP